MKLYEYFGAVGVASLIAWLAVWAVLILWSARTKGMAVCLGSALLAGLAAVYVLSTPEVGQFAAFILWLGVFAALTVVVLWSIIGREIPAAFLALVLSLAAFGLAMWNSDNVSEIEEDRTAEVLAARRRQQAARAAEARKLRSRAADIRFAEDDPDDAMDLAGYTKKEAALLASRPAEADYDYRTGGRKRRDPNMIDTQADALTQGLADQGAPRASLLRGPRALPGEDYVRANQLDRMNRFAARLTVVVALILAGAEYLRRFSRTFGSILPLPIDCRAIDALWPKTHTVLLADAGEQTVRRYLAAAVQKGQSFICFAPRDPWPQARALARLPVGRLWALPKIACPPLDPAYGGRVIFESAWYGRYAFVIVAPDAAAQAGTLLAEFIDLLRMRWHTRAAAARTLNVLWALPEPPADDALRELAFLCRETNVKLLIPAAGIAQATAAAAFEETCTP